MIVERIEPSRYTLFASEADLVRDLATRAVMRTTGPLERYAVEIGAYQGQQTVRLARHFRPFEVALVVIDPFDGTQDGAGEQVYQAWQQATAHLRAPHLQFRRERSQDATPPTPLCFVLHDGDHRDPDLRKWWDALMPGGVLIVHDICDPGWPKVREAAEDLGKPWHEYQYVPSVDEWAEYGPGPRGVWWKIKP